MRRVPLADASGRLLLPGVWVAETSWERTRGLLGRPRLAPGEGMWLPRCRFIHTCGMGYAIDVVFADALGRVVRVAAGLRPWRLAWAWAAAHTLELPAGGAAPLGLEPGVALRVP